MQGIGPDTILFIEDRALRENGADRGELMMSFSPQLNPHLLQAFTPPLAQALRVVLRLAA